MRMRRMASSTLLRLLKAESGSSPHQRPQRHCQGSHHIGFIEQMVKEAQESMPSGV